MFNSSKTRAVASFLIILAIWWFASGNLFVEQIVPKPKDVAAVFVELIGKGELFSHIFASFKRIAIGYALGVSVGFSIGLLTGVYSLARTMAYPFIEFFRCIPPVALIPLVVSLFGIRRDRKILHHRLRGDVRHDYQYGFGCCIYSRYPG